LAYRPRYWKRAREEVELALEGDLEAGDARLVAVERLDDLLELAAGDRVDRVVLQEREDEVGDLLVEHARLHEADRLEVALDHEVEVRRAGRLEVRVAEGELVVVDRDLAVGHEVEVVRPGERARHGGAEDQVRRALVADVDRREDVRVARLAARRGDGLVVDVELEAGVFDARVLDADAGDHAPLRAEALLDLAVAGGDVLGRVEVAGGVLVGPVLQLEGAGLNRSKFASVTGVVNTP
jgi:hypothetical protein